MKDPDEIQLTADQQTVLDFLRDNADFFAAPFNSPYPFKLWVEESTARSKLITDFTGKLREALANDDSAYKSAVSSNGNTDLHNSLVYGNDERIIKLLVRNEQFVVVLMNFAHEQEQSKLVEGWYNSDQGLTAVKRNTNKFSAARAEINTDSGWKSACAKQKKSKISWAERQKIFETTQEKTPLLFEPIAAIEICLFILGEDSSLQDDIINLRLKLSTLMGSPKPTTPNSRMAYTSAASNEFAPKNVPIPPKEIADIAKQISILPAKSQSPDALSEKLRIHLSVLYKATLSEIDAEKIAVLNKIESCKKALVEIKVFSADKQALLEQLNLLTNYKEDEVLQFLSNANEELNKINIIIKTLQNEEQQYSILCANIPACQEIQNSTLAEKISLLHKMAEAHPSLPTAQRNLSGLKERLDGLQREIAEYKTALARCDEVEKNVDRLLNNLEKISDFTTDFHNLTEQLNNIKQRISQLKHGNLTLIDIQNLNSELRSIEESINAILLEKQALLAAESEIMRARNELPTKLVYLTSKIASLHNALDQLNNDISAYKTQNYSERDFAKLKVSVVSKVASTKKMADEIKENDVSLGRLITPINHFISITLAAINNFFPADHLEYLSSARDKLQQITHHPIEADPTEIRAYFTQAVVEVKKLVAEKENVLILESQLRAAYKNLPRLFYLKAELTPLNSALEQLQTKIAAYKTTKSCEREYSTLQISVASGISSVIQAAGEFKQKDDALVRLVTSIRNYMGANLAAIDKFFPADYREYLTAARCRLEQIANHPAETDPNAIKAYFVGAIVEVKNLVVEKEKVSVLESQISSTHKSLPRLVWLKAQLSPLSSALEQLAQEVSVYKTRHHSDRDFSALQANLSSKIDTIQQTAERLKQQEKARATGTAENLLKWMGAGTGSTGKTAVEESDSPTSLRLPKT